MDIQTILSQIDLGSYALPEFQRGYVWNRDQVRKLMNSLYHGYPIGGLLVWVTPTNEDITRGDGVLTPGSVNLILDGQQRITSLYGIIKGKPPNFFEGNQNAFTGLHFNLADESFEFYAPLKMKDNPNWVNVTDLMLKGVGNFIQEAFKINSEKNGFLLEQMDKLNKINNIKAVDLHVQQVAGEDKTIDVVVDIFNNVNSGGTKLSKGDLALARICAQWPEARNEMKNIITKLRASLYNFELDWLLRCVTVYLTGKPYFSELTNIPTSAFQTGLTETNKLIERILNHIGSRLGLDHDRVLGSRYSIPLMVGYLKKQGGTLNSSAEWNKLMYWYIHTFLWGRYAGSTESVLAQDLNIIDSGEGVDGLIRLLRQNRGDLTIRPEDFWGWGTGARFYPLLYLLTRVNHAKDWGSGLELSNTLLGRNSSLEIHHIFPKNVLYKHKYSKALVNSLGNYTFLTKDTNIKISDKEPSIYISEFIKSNPGVVESHWIPTDYQLLSVEKYEQFLGRRRELLAESTNQFLDSLIDNSISQVEIHDYANRDIQTILFQDEDESLLEVNRWMSDRGLAQGVVNFELIDKESNFIMTIDIAWPQGIQSDLSEPLALLINENESQHEIVNQNGYIYFTCPEDFKSYVEKHYL
ncbi:MAG: DUF262 domain-containing protein [Treponema sp.]|nr:DUF262 domain-containing protein [Treponema sp.]